MWLARSALEGAEDTLVSASGMNAATTMLLALVPQNGHIVTTTDCYFGTRQFIQKVLPKMGITVCFSWFLISQYSVLLHPSTNQEEQHPMCFLPSLVPLDMYCIVVSWRGCFHRATNESNGVQRYSELMTAARWHSSEDGSPMSVCCVPLACSAASCRTLYWIRLTFRA